MSVIGSNILAGASGQGGYFLTNSLRFRSSANAYLNRTFSTPTDNKKFTWSGWVKRGTLGAFQVLQVGDDSTSDNFLFLRFGDTDTLQCFQSSGGSYNLQVSTSAVFRDPSAWYHIVFIYDSANATSTNRIQFYVNGVLQTVSYAVGPFSINTASQLNVASRPNAIGRLLYASVNYFDGYLAEVNFIDGQALTPSSFGETSASTGVWQPKKYTGTYGTNGFYLDFEDTSSTAALGYDAAGSNDWTVNNISLTAGSTYDSMTDVPTLTSATAGNYCTWNPLNRRTTTHIKTASAGNLNVSGDTDNTGLIFATIYPTTGKWYFEFSPANTYANSYIGIGNTSENINQYPGNSANSVGLEIGSGAVYKSSLLATYTGISAGEIGMIAWDCDTGKVWIGRQGAWFNSGDPAAGTGQVTTLTAGENGAMVSPYSSSGVISTTFGQRPFFYTPPTGFVALNTFNISAGTITTSGSFTGNAATDGPFIYLNGVPTAMTINGNAVTFGTDADKLSNGFKVRSSSASYNASGSNTYSISTTSDKFKFANAQPNP